jgi:hypothetical protein
MLYLFGSALLALEPKFTVGNLDWLRGCWKSNNEGTEITEQWMKPAGGTMLGMSRTVSNGKTLEFEFMQIRQEGSGEILFVAKPSGQKEASFKMVKGGKQEVTFENPGHDFPQRIIYRLDRDGALAARIEGISKGKLKAVDFLLRRISCE